MYRSTAGDVSLAAQHDVYFFICVHLLNVRPLLNVIQSESEESTRATGRETCARKEGNLSRKKITLRSLILSLHEEIVSENH
jgi:hypothetical protein